VRFNELEVVASEPPRKFAVRTNAGPTPFLYRYQLSAENGETVMKLVILDGVARFVSGSPQPSPVSPRVAGLGFKGDRPPSQRVGPRHAGKRSFCMAAAPPSPPPVK
jgi:hypothetical protein